MPRHGVRVALATAAALAGMAYGCSYTPARFGSFERTLRVSGPVRLDVENGSGSVQIRAGEAGQVRIRGEVRARASFWQGSRQRMAEITTNPPIEQQGNLIRLGHDKERLRAVTVNYDIVVPAETELESEVGSGRLEVRGIHGPARATTGSGRITMENIGADAVANTGSGALELARVGGEVRAGTGSGSITLSEIRGDIRATTGSGGITIDRPGGRIAAKTGSGGVTVNGAAADLRASTGSGSVTVEGNPEPNSYWELRTSSGRVAIGVPSSASFRLHARSNSGRIQTDIPLVIEERTKREMRGRIGAGAARVEAYTGSGAISVR